MKSIAKITLATLAFVATNPVEGFTQASDTSTARIILIVKKSILEDFKQELKLYAGANGHVFVLFDAPQSSTTKPEYFGILSPGETEEERQVREQHEAKEQSEYINNLLGKMNNSEKSQPTTNQEKKIPPVHKFTSEEIGFEFDEIIINGFRFPPDADGSFFAKGMKSGDTFIFRNSKTGQHATKKF